MSVREEGVARALGANAEVAAPRNRMTWILQALGNAPGLVVALLVYLAMQLFYAVLDALVNHLVLPLLKGTVFAPFSFNGHTWVAQTAIHVWETGGLVSAGIALVLFVFGALTRMANIGGQRSWAEMAEGITVWVAVMVGGWTFLNLLLGISNAATQSLLAAIQQSITSTLVIHHNAGLTLAVGVVPLLVYAIGQILELVLVALLIWVVGVWLMRQVDLVLYAGILPVTAALGVAGNKTAFKWAWAEAMGAVFNQLAMAVILWIGSLFLTNLHGIPPNGWSQGTAQLMGVLLAATTFTLAARAPRILANITGHQSAGASHVMAQTALGYLGAKGLSNAWSASRAGQAARLRQEGKESTARHQVLEAAGRQTVGERFSQSAAGQWLNQQRTRVSDAIHQSSVGQAAAGFAAQHPRGADFARGLGALAQGAAKPLRTAASAAYQPITTMGRAAAAGYADSSPYGPAGELDQSREATVFMAQHGVQAAADRFFGDDPRLNAEERVQALGHLTASHIAPHPETGGHTVEFARGSWQQAVYDKTRTSTLRNIPPITPPRGSNMVRYEMDDRPLARAARSTDAPRA